jgi:very-short-patch-repair endonuclease
MFITMIQIDSLINDDAANNYGLTTRPRVLGLGGTDRMIATRLANQRWREVQVGVYLVGVTPLSWHGRLRAATLAGGEAAVASHRAAVMLWGLEGLNTGLLELTVPVGRGPVPVGVIVHRTRRTLPRAVVEGIPVTSVERTILDTASCVPPLVVETAFESAARRRLTTPHKMAICLAEQGGAGVRGRGVVVRLLDQRRPGRAAGSPAETLLAHRMRKAGIEEPVRQHAILLPDGSVAVVDFGWPGRRRAVEIDGLDAHSSAQALEYDLQRQNLIMQAVWSLRRFSARMVRRHPDQVVEEIIRLLDS